MNGPKIHTLFVTDGLSVTDHASVVKTTDDRVVGFVETQRDAVQSRADLTADGKIDSSVDGRSPQGESDTLVAARILVAHLNTRGGNWSEPVIGTASSDCISEDHTAPSRLLQMQVVRAIADQRLWKGLAAVGSAQRSYDINALVAELESAIKDKTARYADSDRVGLVLVLDANRIPAFALSDVRDAVTGQLQLVCAASKFAAVWLVGPTPDLTYALHVGIA